MNKHQVVMRINSILEPMAFRRRKTTWNRSSGELLDVVNVQFSKATNSATMNAGALNPSVYRTCWGRPPNQFVEEPHCTIRARVGQLLDGKDIWWNLGDEDACEKMGDCIRTIVLPFLEHNHTPTAMEQYLSDHQAGKHKHAPETIYLAILKYELGRKQEACALLHELQQRIIGNWKARVGEVRDRLGCSEDPVDSGSV